jgi:hypothetical protein
VSFLVEVAAATMYGIIAILSWLVFTCWLHDTKPDFKSSWIMPVVLGLFLGFFWPVSLTMLVVYENTSKPADKIETADDEA